MVYLEILNLYIKISPIFSMKKITMIALLSIVLLSGCIAETDKIRIDHEMTLSSLACSERNFDNKVTIIESKYCASCVALKPSLLEIEDELDTTFNYIDIAELNGQDKLNDLGLEVAYTPTIIIGCNVYIGAKSKEKYKTLVEDFLNKA